MNYWSLASNGGLLAKSFYGFVNDGEHHIFAHHSSGGDCIIENQYLQLVDLGQLYPHSWKSHI